MWRRGGGGGDGWPVQRTCRGPAVGKHGAVQDLNSRGHDWKTGGRGANRS